MKEQLVFDSRTLNVGLIGAGRIGSSHAQLIARAIPNARLAAVADPVDGAAARLAESLGVDTAYTDITELL
ncbi:Gfo/Idh/MocA family oxidoreductase, partial [Kocuria himachalensis]